MRRLIVLAILLIATSAQAGTTTVHSPSAATGTNWTSATNVYGSNDAWASYAAASQDVNKVTTYGFTSGELTDSMTIVGISVGIEGQGTSTTAANRSIQAGLTKDGSALAGSYETAQNFTRCTSGCPKAASDSTLTFGSASSMWGTTWSPSEIRATTFGVLVRVGNTDTTIRYVDYVSVTVTYTGGRRRSMVISRPWQLKTRSITRMVAVG